jgi:hypothetical protein
MQNETTVKTSGTLSYYAGALRVARADVQRVENNAADYGAMHAEAMEAARAELAAAEFDFRCEFAAFEVLEQLELLHAAPVAVEPVKVSRVRCAHYKAIRRAFAIAKDAGLDVSKAGKARARHAMEDVIGQCVNSRSEYSGSDWMRFGDAVKSGAARW